MVFSKRKISIVILLCFIWVFSFVVPSFAETPSSPAESVGTELQSDPVNPAGEVATTSSAIDSDTPGDDDTIILKSSAESDDNDSTMTDDNNPESPDVEPSDDTDDSTGSAVDEAVTPTSPAITDDKQEEDNNWYCPKISMKKEHQKLLWDYCEARNIDYIDMLALISLESNFYEKSSNGRYKGYFQISSKNAAGLARTLKTANKPLDGAININWGTAMYSWILADKRVKNLEGKNQRDAALSIYQRGTGGYDKYGISKNFLAKYYKKRNIIGSYFDKS